ncbi:MAG: ribose 5-phosphate isomerase B [Candidatus Omnitrophica bacterium]|nr:ribose 5-phosphate isomerase B [Candidatus Omnitrophota bacterium]MDD5671219.1 ribose 5-phosphate isomerase B [Candidatus Omnitrophota bacterium]
MSQKIALACDHRGFKIKEQLKTYLPSKGFQVVDCGAFSETSVDYPDFIFAAAEKVSRGDCFRAIGICYSGIGSSIVANKVKGIRAALCQHVKEAELSRLHNDSNMLILGSAFVKEDVLIPLVETWLKTPFEGGRHENRVNKIKTYEQSNGGGCCCG